MSNKTPIITVSAVCKQIGMRHVLQDVSFVVHEAELLAIIGPNGAGKTTLIKIILGLDTRYTGTVTVAPNARIRYIQQLAVDARELLPLSVYEYLSVGATTLYSGVRTQPDFMQAIAHVGLPETILRQSFSDLSGGERQRVAIARALLSNPSVLVLDEPLAAVDYHSRDELYKLIRHLQEVHQITVILVSHDIDSVIPISDNVLCLNRTIHHGCHPVEFARTHSVHHHS